MIKVCCHFIFTSRFIIYTLTPYNWLPFTNQNQRSSVNIAVCCKVSSINMETSDSVNDESSNLEAASGPSKYNVPTVIDVTNALFGEPTKMDQIFSYTPNDMDCRLPAWYNRCQTGCLQASLMSVAFIVAVCMILFLCRDYVRGYLLWLEEQDEWIVFFMFVGLFTIISFPMTWGYLLLNLAAGYLFGVVRGFIVVSISVIIGVIIAHLVIRRFLTDFVLSRLINYENFNAIIAVLGGQQAFKVVALTRLTPIPYGLQNALFSISNITTSTYIAATFIGLIPTQVLNVYLGSTLRSMEDVLSDDYNTFTGYFVFIVQILISIGLMIYVVRRARVELKKAVEEELQHCSHLKDNDSLKDVTVENDYSQSGFVGNAISTKDTRGCDSYSR